MKRHITEEQLEAILLKILARNHDIEQFLCDVLDTTPPEGKTLLDVLTDRLDREGTHEDQEV